jgi:hypothetical protein
MQLTDGVRTLGIDAMFDVLNTGSGTAHVELTESDNTVLSDHDLPNPALGAGSAGVKTFNTIPDEVSGAAGTAAKLRWYDRDDTLRMEMSVGVGAEDVVISSTTVPLGVTISIEGGDGGGTVTQPAGSV